MLCKGPPTHVVIAYTSFLLAMYAMYQSVAERESSAVLTVSVMFQCLALMLLALQSWTTNSAAGISAQSLIVEGLAIACRLSSTTRLEGYLPSDKTGDFFFQVVDLCSLAIVFWLVHRVLVVQKGTYQAEEDTLPAAPIVLVSLVLGIVLHADMDDNPVFDSLWMGGLFMGTFAVVPQLWLIARTKGAIAALTGHYVAAMAASRVASGIFMWAAQGDITCDQWIAGFNHAVWAIFAAHVLHLFLLADFTYHYSVALAKQGVAGRIVLDVV